MRTVTVWDLPTRLFHWAFAFSVAGAIISVQIEEMERHESFAFAACALLIFRLIWGVVGSAPSRFAEFVKGPGAVIAYLSGRGAARLGHNPLGALSVIAMLVLFAVQIGTGLVANDDVLFDGPWSGAIGKSTSDTMTARHHLLSNIVYALIALHLCAILFYAVRKRQNLVRPMVTGRTSVEEATTQPKMTPSWVALPVLGVSVLIAGALFRYWIF